MQRGNLSVVPQLGSSKAKDPFRPILTWKQVLFPTMACHHSPSPARGQRGQRPPATFAITEPSPGAWVLLSPPAQPEETDGLGSLTQTRLGVTSPAESRARPAAQKSWGWRWNSAHTSLRV